MFASFAAQVQGASGDTQLAADTLDVAPGLLGVKGPRTYVVLFAGPAESRELGGFVGNIGILNANDGKLDLDEVVRFRRAQRHDGETPGGSAGRHRG